MKADGAAELLTLLRDHLNLPIPQAHYDDLGELGGNTSPDLRHARTRALLARAATADTAEGTMFDHPLLRLEVGGRHAFVEPDLIAFRLHGRYYVIEIKSFAVIDGQADGDKVAAAAIQSAVYVLALRDALDKRGASVRNLIVWCRDGLQADEVRALLRLGELSGRRGYYEVSGFPDVELLFQAAGPVELVVPELYKPSRRWRSGTPYLPVRHRKRETLDEYLAADVAAELRYRDKPAAVVSRIERGSQMTDRWAGEFRRHRLQEPLKRSRPGMGLRLEFAEEVGGRCCSGSSATSDTASSCRTRIARSS